MGFSFNKICSNVLPVGTYKVQITDIKFKTSSTGAESYDLQVNYTVAEGPCAKRTLIDTIYEKAASFRLKPFLTACGVDTAKEFASIKELYDYGIRAAKGKFLMVEVSIRTYNGNQYNDIKSFAPLPGSTTSAEDVLKAFDTDVELQPEIIPNKPTVTDVPDIPSFEEPKINIDLGNDDDELLLP